MKCTSSIAGEVFNLRLWLSYHNYGDDSHYEHLTGLHRLRQASHAAPDCDFRDYDFPELVGELLQVLSIAVCGHADAESQAGHLARLLEVDELRRLQRTIVMDQLNKMTAST